MESNPPSPFLCLPVLDRSSGEVHQDAEFLGGADRAGILGGDAGIVRRLPEAARVRRPLSREIDVPGVIRVHRFINNGFPLRTE